MTRPIVKFKKLVDSAVIPTYATKGSAGLDLVATEAASIFPGTWAVIKTGLAIELPEGYEAQVRSRSGLAAKHGIAVLNSPGTIDSDYRGEVCVILINNRQSRNYPEHQVPFQVAAGDRIAQLVIAAVEQPILEEVLVLNDTVRGSGGFGSTGVK